MYKKVLMGWVIASRIRNHWTTVTFRGSNEGCARCFKLGKY